MRSHPSACLALHVVIAGVFLLGALASPAHADAIDDFRRHPTGAMILLKEVDDPERFGVAVVEGNRVVSIVEKPVMADSRLAVTGCYLYDPRVFDVIKTLTPSRRGELEITDVNNRYIEWGAMRYRRVNGWWTDAGTVASLHRAANLVADETANRVLREMRRCQ